MSHDVSTMKSFFFFFCILREVIRCILLGGPTLEHQGRPLPGGNYQMLAEGFEEQRFKRSHIVQNSL